jgi:hypothetical protein
MTDVSQPPRLARRLLELVLPPDAREHIIDDLDEVYRHRCQQRTVARARRWYWRETLSFSSRFFVERLRERVRGGRAAGQLHSGASGLVRGPYSSAADGIGAALVPGLRKRRIRSTSASSSRAKARSRGFMPPM